MNTDILALISYLGLFAGAMAAGGINSVAGGGNMGHQIALLSSVATRRQGI